MDYLTGQVGQFVLAAGRQADSGLNTQHELDLAENDLVVKDLGYWNIGQLADYDRAGVYFLFRLKSDATLSRQGPDGGWQRVEVEDLLPAGGELLCHQLGLGKECLAVRVCLERVPEQVREQREQKLRKLAKSQAWNLSERRVRLCGYNMYVTNASSEQLPVSLMRALYGLRWQIEPRGRPRSLQNVEIRPGDRQRQAHEHLPLRVHAVRKAHSGSGQQYVAVGIQDLSRRAAGLRAQRVQGGQGAKKKLGALLRAVVGKVGEVRKWLAKLFHDWAKYARKEHKRKGKKLLKHTPCQVINMLT